MARRLTEVMQIWAPPPKLKISEWADAEFYLSPEDSAEHGKYYVSRAPFQSGILDAFCEDGIEEVVVMSSAQVGKTTILKALIGFYMHNDPSPILLVQPNVEMAETFSKDRLAPMIRDTPCLRDKVSRAKSRDTNNTILKKNFPGGHITMVGANAPSGLASRPIRIVLCDEVDRYPPSAGTEGDPVNLGKKRTITFRKRKKIAMFSTPGIKGKSRIERAYLASDRRKYYVPCPHCGHYHTLDWDKVHIVDDDPNTAALICPECGSLIQDCNKIAMLNKGEWRKENETGGIIAGFYINELYSPWRKFSDVARDYYASKGNPEEEKTWINTSLGLPSEEHGEIASAELLKEKIENYGTDSIPPGVITITAGCDIQKDRIELEVVGWGVGEESWGIEYITIKGDPGQPELWNTLDTHLLTSRYPTDDGRTLRIAACCVDSGGHHWQQVYEFCTTRMARNIWAVKGRSGNGPVWPKKVSTSKKYKGHHVRIIHVDTAKDTIYSRWQTNHAGMPGYCHFPNTYTMEWFAGATCEKRVTRLNNKGREVRAWEKPKGSRNEPLDCRVYAYAAIQGLKVERGLIINKKTYTDIIIDNDNNAPKVKTFEQKPLSVDAPIIANVQVPKKKRISRKSTYLKIR